MSNKMHHAVSHWFDDSSEFFPLQKSPGEVVLLLSFGLNDRKCPHAFRLLVSQNHPAPSLSLLECGEYR